ncbi:hypothetical protein [Streptomyces swartbergensis]|uniref:Uncharacterized protein n=1 Tax=Streptomyces swartbergensis TaxID=487165 RepID=A0A243SBM4_9ACTN|nr:hypothetical protein [Streptomyces swartbergensis]OUD04726.1 hypothetical protein CA983_02945 [Streptomyces swartbergensis]
MSIEIRFVGGPADGRTYAIPDDTPPPLYLIPIAPPISELFPNGRVEPSPIQKAEYEPLRQDGWPRRADDGAYLYKHRAAPLTVEERDALARERAEVRAAEERRTAELDEAWQEIRRERPHYPESWRAL